MKRNVCLLSLIFLLISGMILGAKFYEKKPYTQWKEKDARKLLQKSPWTYEFQWGRTGDIGQYVTSPGYGTTSDSQATPSEREFVTIIRISLFSSRPIRQAYVALAAKGDKEKLERFKDFATREINDEIILSWQVDSKPKGVSSVIEMMKQLNDLSSTILKNNTFLATNTGKKVFLKDYRKPSPDGTGAKFIFPRTLEDGTLLITENDKSVKFQTKRFTIADNEVAIDATFKVKKLKFDGKLDY